MSLATRIAQEFNTVRSEKVDKVTGKGLSAEDFTTALKNKLDLIQTEATDDQTPSEILAALLTVDGSGTGLDADLLDGQHATAFAAADHGHDAAEVPYSNLTSGLAAADVQAAIDETESRLDTAETKLTGIEPGATADQTSAVAMSIVFGG